MKKYRKNLILALVCFLIVIVLNFFLPRLLPGNPIAYLTGFSEEDMTPAQVAYYRQALHLDKPVFVQFGYYLRSLADGTLGYSFKKEATVSALIGQRLGYTLQITLPAVLLSTVIGLLWGLRCGYKKGSSFEKISTTFQIIINTMPTFLIALVLLILFCFRQRWFPYTGLNSARAVPGTAGYFWDRIHHLILPVLTLTNAAGFKATKCTEKKIAKAAAALTAAFAEADVPKVNVVTGKAFGSAYVTMNSKGLGADIVYAWPNAQIGMMDAKMAVKVMYPEADAKELREKAAAYAELQNSVASAAKRGYVDTVIDAQDTRKYVIGAFEMLFTKREDRPGKKHGTV
mgnify:CR=1 FL=1